MRRALAIVLIVVPFTFGCAKAVTVNLDVTYPVFNTVSLTSCVATSDSCKDLARAELWVQRQGQTDSTLIVNRTLTPSRAGQPDIFQADQPEGTSFYWLYLFDLVGNRSCRSNIASKTVTQPPAAATVQ